MAAWREAAIREMLIDIPELTATDVLRDSRFEGLGKSAIASILSKLRGELGLLNRLERARERDAIVRAAIFDALDRVPGRLTVRQIMYIVGNSGVLAEAKPYAVVQRLLVEMRLDGTVFWERIEDRTRDSSWDTVADARPFELLTLSDIAENWTTYKPSSIEGLADRTYKDLVQLFGLEHRPPPLWTLPQLEGERCVRPIVFCEKDTLRPQIEAAVRNLNVGVFSTRGFSSLSQTYDLAKAIMAEADNYGIGHVALWVHDFDRAGQRLQESAMRALRNHGCEIEAETIALTAEQVVELDIQLHIDPLASAETVVVAGDEDDEVEEIEGAAEVEAVPPEVLAGIVRRAVEARLPYRREGTEDRHAFDVRNEIAERVRGRRRMLDTVTDSYMRPDGELDPERVRTQPTVDDLKRAIDDEHWLPGAYNEEDYE